MGSRTAIAWCNRTWNPWRGCRRITAGCARCYMFTAQERYGQDPGVIVRTKTWGDPRKWQREAERLDRTFRIFTCSWSDFFIKEADAWRAEAWELIRDTPRLQYQILTKRPERVCNHLPWNCRAIGSAQEVGAWKNVWLGVSVENRKQGLPRIDILREVPAAIRFLSIEPLLEDLGPIDLDGIDWVIVGGESGPDFRPMRHKWAISIRDQCRAASVPFFFKQSAAARTEMGIELEGEIVREFPKLAPLRPVGQASLFEATP